MNEMAAIDSTTSATTKAAMAARRVRKVAEGNSRRKYTA